MAIRRRRNMRRRPTQMRRRPGRSMRRRSNRRRSLVRPNAFGARGIVGLPPRMKIKMRYVNVYYPTINASTTQNYYFTTNIQDVETATAGNQRPLYYNQMVGLYGRYYVSGFRYVVKIVNRSNEVEYVPIVFSAQVRNGPVIDANPGTGQERWYDKDRILPQGLTMVKGYVPVGLPWGLSKSRTFMDEDFAGNSAGAVPATKQSFLCLSFQNPLSIAGNYFLNIQITYDVYWSELLSVATS